MTILAVNQTDFQNVFYFFEASIFITKFSSEDDNHIYQKFQRIGNNIAYLGFKFRKVK